MSAIDGTYAAWPQPPAMIRSVPDGDRTARLDELGDEIAELSAHLQAATARLLSLIRQFDAEGGWGNGFRSCAEWLSWRVGMSPGVAREHVRVARALGNLPLVAKALSRGEISYAKARAITRVCTTATQERLLGVARSASAKQTETIVRAWRRVDALAEAKDAERQHARRGLYLHDDEDGTVVVRGRLAPEVGALLRRALEAAREELYQRARRRSLDSQLDPSMVQPSLEQQQADALALLAESALRSGLDPGNPGERYQVVVHVDAQVLADRGQDGQSVLEDGGRVAAATSERLACDAGRVVMQHDQNGRVVDIGTRTRTIPPAIRRALAHRDHGCRFPGCGVRVTQGHHLKHWAQGGETTLGNLVLLCRRHHRAVHEEGYGAIRLPEGGLRFLRPDGQELPQVPAPGPVAEDPVQALKHENAARGIDIHPRTGCALEGSPSLDVGWAIDVLHPRARGETPASDEGPEVAA